MSYLLKRWDQFLSDERYDPNTWRNRTRCLTHGDPLGTGSWSKQTQANRPVRQTILVLGTF